jgi:hypothetical protein
MNRKTMMAAVGVSLAVGVTAGWAVGDRLSGQMPVQAAIATAEGRAHLFGCEHAPQKDWHMVRVFDYEPAKSDYTVIWEICTGDPTEERVRITDADFKKTFFQFDNDEVVRVERLDLLDNHVPQLLVLTMSAGTGDDIDWHVLGESNGALKEWKPPDYEGPAERLLRADEDFCCKDWNFHLQGNEIVLARGIYQKGEGNCCPSRGGVLVRLQPADDGFKLASVVRISKSEYELLRGSYFCLSCKLY